MCKDKLLTIAVNMVQWNLVGFRSKTTKNQERKVWCYEIEEILVVPVVLRSDII